MRSPHSNFLRNICGQRWMKPDQVMVQRRLYEDEKIENSVLLEEIADVSMISINHWVWDDEPETLIERPSGSF